MSFREKAQVLPFDTVEECLQYMQMPLMLLREPVDRLFHLKPDQKPFVLTITTESGACVRVVVDQPARATPAAQREG